MSARYQLAPLFSIRVTGAPYELLERTVTTGAAAAARAVLQRQAELERAADHAAARMRSLVASLPQAARERAQRDVRHQRPLAPEAAGAATELTDYARAHQEYTKACQLLEDELARELPPLRQAVRDALPYLRRFSVFCSEEVHALIARQAQDDTEVFRSDSHSRKRERTLLHYLQRIGTKNDTFSDFGPGGWGSITAQRRGLGLMPRPGTARRLAYLEKWVAEEVIGAMNRDPEIRAEIAPRLHPLARIQGSTLIREDTGVTLELDAEALAVLVRCDGRTPAYALNAPAVLARLAAEGAVRWELEVITLDPERFDRLLAEVSGWRPGAARERWLERIEGLARLPREFAAADEPTARRALMEQARRALTEMGGGLRGPKRTLYTASNPIAEECHRDCNLVLGGDLAEQLAADVGPWLDLWRDVIGYVCLHVNEHLSRLYQSAPAGSRRSLATFLRYCESQGASLTGDGFSRLVRSHYQRLQRAFGERVNLPAAVEWELSGSDCAFVRGLPDYRPWRGTSVWPAVDLQLAARSVEAVDSGDYRWVIGELNVPRVLVGHARYWSCPDYPLLHGILRTATLDQPFCQWAPRLEDRITHVSSHWPSAFPERWTAVGVERLRPQHRYVAPVDAQPYLEESSGELRLRESGSGRDLGSFVAPWNFQMAIGTHPFVFQRPPYLPRLRLGRVIVQRRCWTIQKADLSDAPAAGISSKLVLDIERLRASRGWPRWVFIRPSDEVLVRFHAEGRDKDVKPAYIDLESYPFLVMLSRTLHKYGEIEVTEMLPDPTELCWREADGRRTFELRGQFLPTSG